MTHEEIMIYCEAIISDLAHFERNEPFIPGCPRDVAIAAWVIRQLASPGNLDSERVLRAIMERRTGEAAEREAGCIADFCQRFDTWIMNQAETVKFSSALAFGEEYRRLRECILNEVEGLAAKEAVRE